jgi:hypothetical protein
MPKDVPGVVGLPPHPRRASRARLTVAPFTVWQILKNAASIPRPAGRDLAEPSSCGPRRKGSWRWTSSVPTCSTERLSPRAAGPDPGVESAAPDDRAARVRGLLQQPPAAPRPEPGSAAQPGARWRHRPRPLPRLAARSRRGRDSRISPGGVGFRHPQSVGRSRAAIVLRGSVRGGPSPSGP